MSSTIPITNARLLEISAGFADLLGRPFPTAISRQRAAFQYASIQPALDGYREGLKDLQARELDIKGKDDDASNAERRAVVAEFTDYLAQMVDVPAPRKRLVESDLPRASSDTGDANARATLQLSPEFFLLADPDAEC